MPVLLGPPVLPPLDPTAFNDSDIQIRGGNVTISGIRVEGLTAASSGGASWTDTTVTAAESTTGSNTSNASTTTAAAPQRPAFIALFNGTLAFTTLRMLIEIRGQFELQRAMQWSWDAQWAAYTTQVCRYERNAYAYHPMRMRGHTAQHVPSLHYTGPTCT